MDKPVNKTVYSAHSIYIEYETVADCIFSLARAINHMIEGVEVEEETHYATGED